jgi:hypothetical protein
VSDADSGAQLADAERTAADYQASASAPRALAAAPAPPAEPELEGPIDAELAGTMAEHNDRLAALEAIVDADDKLAAAVAENVKSEAQSNAQLTDPSWLICLEMLRRPCHKFRDRIARSSSIRTSSASLQPPRYSMPVMREAGSCRPCRVRGRAPMLTGR